MSDQERYEKWGRWYEAIEEGMRREGIVLIKDDFTDDLWDMDRAVSWTIKEADGYCGELWFFAEEAAIGVGYGDREADRWQPFRLDDPECFPKAAALLRRVLGRVLGPVPPATPEGPSLSERAS
jgi:hypothetical protein